MRSFTAFKRRSLKNPKIRAEYERLKPQYELISKVVELRVKHELSQKDLGKKMKVQQAAIARFERGNGNPTVSSLQRIAKAFNKRLVIDFK